MRPAAAIYEVHISVARAVAPIVSSATGTLIASASPITIIKVSVRPYSERVGPGGCPIVAAGTIVSIVSTCAAVVEPIDP